MNPSFKGGMHISEHKDTRNSAIEKMPAPKIVKISMAQHSGRPMSAVVAPGDYVYRGQVIGMSDANIACPIHSSVSGTVKAIEIMSDAGRACSVEAVVIENDGLDTLDPSIEGNEDVTALSGDEVVELVRRAGVVGMGGAVFPSYAKIKSSTGKAKTLLVNCAECEPYITADHRIMLEEADEVIGGIDILIRAMGVEKAILAIEDNKLDAAELLAEKVKGREDIEVRLLKTKYPQGEKSQIIYALTGIEPTHGVRLSDIGYVIFNVGSCAAVYRACRYGMPLLDRVVTVAGDCIAEPKNVLAPIGTPIVDVIDFCGGFVREPCKIINGGRMMGAAQWIMEGAITKSTSALLALSDGGKKASVGQANCINCGRCVGVCPMHLMPNYLARYSALGRYADCEKYNVNDCMECGTCTYICPGRVEIIQHIRVAKDVLWAAKKR